KDFWVFQYKNLKIKRKRLPKKPSPAQNSKTKPSNTIRNDDQPENDRPYPSNAIVIIGWIPLQFPNKISRVEKTDTNV
ncbi:MAG: hypothetical protein Q7S28_02005, partial [bacterium]|nr:hypothetical protein [bacterium]